MLEAISLGPERTAAAALLFTRASDADAALPQLLAPLGSRGAGGWRRLLGWFAGCPFGGAATGHYELDLSLPAHRAVAMRLKDVAWAEPEGSINWVNIIHDHSTGGLPQGSGGAGVGSREVMGLPACPPALQTASSGAQLAASLLAPLPAPHPQCHSSWMAYGSCAAATGTDKTAGSFGPPAQWRGLIPRQGLLAFDFVSGLVPTAPPGAAVLLPAPGAVATEQHTPGRRSVVAPAPVAAEQQTLGKGGGDARRGRALDGEELRALLQQVRRQLCALACYPLHVTHCSPPDPWGWCGAPCCRLVSRSALLQASPRQRRTLSRQTSRWLA